MVEVAKIMISLVESLAEFDQDKLEEDSKIVHEKQCEFDLNGQSFMKSVAYLKNNKKEIQESILKGINFYSTKMAGYVCTLCDLKSHESVSWDSEIPRISVDYRQCETFFNDNLFSEFAKMEVALKQLVIVYGGLYCLYHQELPLLLDQLPNPEDLESYVNEYQNCASNKNIQFDTNCQTKCKDMQFFNFNKFQMFTWALVIFDLVKVDLLNQNPINFKDKSFKKAFEDKFNNVYTYFWLNPLDSYENIEHISKEYIYGDGWNIFDHFFIYNEFKKINLLETSNKILLTK
jgi:hypothetical protein